MSDQQYEDSVEFTEEMVDVLNTINSPRMEHWMRMTDSNYGTNTMAKLKRARNAINELWAELESADE